MKNNLRLFFTILSQRYDLISETVTPEIPTKKQTGKIQIIASYLSDLVASKYRQWTTPSGSTLLDVDHVTSTTKPILTGQKNINKNYHESPINRAAG